jgi:hypothetical protein
MLPPKPRTFRESVFVFSHYYLILHISLLTVKFRQPSHEFTFGVGLTFVSYPLVLTPVV